MCTCCITRWPCRPAFYWIVHSRHSWAAVGYVTGWAHAFLSVCGGVSRGTTGAPSKRRSALSTLLPPRGCDPCAPPHPPMSPLLFFFFPLLLSRSLSGKKALLVTLWPKCTDLLMPVCLSWSHSSLLLRALSMCKWFAQVFQQHFTTHPAAVASVYIMSDSVCCIFFCWFYQRWWELARRNSNARAQLNHLFFICKFLLLSIMNCHVSFFFSLFMWKEKRDLLSKEVPDSCMKESCPLPTPKSGPGKFNDLFYFILFWKLPCFNTWICPRCFILFFLNYFSTFIL